MTLTVTLFITIAVLAIIMFACANQSVKDKRKIKQLETELETKEKNIEYLFNHIKKIEVIKNDEKSTSKKIEGAKTDEEVRVILSDVISDNNSRVQNNKAEKN